MALPSWTKQQVIDQLDTGFKWTGPVITYSFPTTSAGMYGTTEKAGFKALNAAQQQATTLALQTWDDLIAPSLQKVSNSTSNIEVASSSTGVGYAHAYLPNVGSVWFGASYADLMAPVVGKHSFLTYVHELGHAFGLDHMGNYNGSGNWTPSSYQDSSVYSIMSYFGPNWGVGSKAGEGLVAWADWIGADGQTYAPQTPMVNDIMAIQAMYGADTTTRTGSTVYGFGCNLSDGLKTIYDFAQNRNPILTIYDAGGNDTLNLSGFTTASNVDLRDGAYSSCNSMTMNIAIAYGSIIENAVGGSGSDILTGNSAANRLEGGAGDDKLYGGDGDDMLYGGTGNDLCEGGNGADTAYLTTAFSTFTWKTAGSDLLLTHASGTSTFRGIEKFHFADGTVKTLADFSVAPPKVVVNPVVSISTASASVVEGNSGSKAIIFTVKLDKAATTAQSVAWTAAGSGTSAAASSDFASALNGTLTFNPGETSKTLQVLVAGDTVVEANEQFTVSLSAPSAGLNLSSTDKQAAVTINNDDVAPAPVVSISTASASVVEGNSGSKAIIFTVKLDKAATTAQSVAWTAAGSGTSAAASSDFASALNGTLTFNPGETSKTLQVLVAGDTVVEANEQFTVSLSAPSAGLNLSSTDKQAAVTINNDDVLPADDFGMDTATAPLLAINGTSITGTIERPTDGDLFKLNLLSGQVYELVMAKTTGTLNPFIELYSSAGQFLAFNDNDATQPGTTNAKLTFVAPVTGTYYIAAYDSFENAQGGYTLTAKTAAAPFNTVFGSAFNDSIFGSSQADKLLGLGGNDVLSGEGGNDILAGGYGMDKLTGGAGSDLFRFDTLQAASSADNVDTITDFARGIDKIDLENAVFTKLTAEGALAAAYFLASATGKALDANDYVLFNTTNGTLWYDSDGNGANAAIQLTTLIGVSNLAVTDFMIS